MVYIGIILTIFTFIVLGILVALLHIASNFESIEIHLRDIRYHYTGQMYEEMKEYFLNEINNGK